MYRTHNCGSLNIKNQGEQVTLCGWVQKIRNKGFMIWIDLRDQYGITQIVFDKERTSLKLFEKVREINREYVLKIKGTVIKRISKNSEIKTGDIEILAEEFEVLNVSKTPPFTLEEKTDGGEELRMKYRYLDIRRSPIKKNLLLRSKVTQIIREFLSENGFIDIETPYLIKSTPEGARDFIVPSRINSRKFYALPQSPQTFKQLLMIGGIDKYYQIVKCFRDEDLRADRQPEFTQIDCEMSFVTQENVINQFEKLLKTLLFKIKGIRIEKFPRLTYKESIEKYGNDKPDIRFGMELNNLNYLLKGNGFKIFDSNKINLGIFVPQGSSFTRKEIDNLTSWVKAPQIGANGLIWIKFNLDGSIKSSIDKFFNSTQLIKIFKKHNGKKGDLLLIISGNEHSSRIQMSSLRMELASRLKLRDPNKFAPLWITDFPLLEEDKENKCFNSVHHPFTSPKSEQINLLDSDPKKITANAYDLILNGNEIGGGSIRIHNSDLQEKILKLLGFSKKEAISQFGFLIEALKYGAPPHGGIALGLDRLVAILGGQEIIRDFIAFPKNNSGKDIMIDSPSEIDKEQLNDLNLSID
ncbi:MAG: aspartate--tRNA ligase [Flavobacteriaceae bacterium]|nr:aspartate--tRNA ligase [Flavobacteriaceae bacterium]